jgi:hypothetical protein
VQQLVAGPQPLPGPSKPHTLPPTARAPLQKDEFLRLSINAIHSDLISRNESFQCLALTFVANSELAPPPLPPLPCGATSTRAARPPAVCAGCRPGVYLVPWPASLAVCIAAGYASAPRLLTRRLSLETATCGITSTLDKGCCSFLPQPTHPRPPPSPPHTRALNKTVAGPEMAEALTPDVLKLIGTGSGARS